MVKEDVFAGSCSRRRQGLLQGNPGAPDSRVAGGAVDVFKAHSGPALQVMRAARPSGGDSI